ncbi:hypothetical protein [Agathobaculum sp.]|nr:hypothetical protein [Agathobaculum sp.]
MLRCVDLSIGRPLVVAVMPHCPAIGVGHSLTAPVKVSTDLS